VAGAARRPRRARLLQPGCRVRALGRVLHAIGEPALADAVLTEASVELAAVCQTRVTAAQPGLLYSRRPLSMRERTFRACGWRRRRQSGTATGRRDGENNRTSEARVART
jgi:hypothetical protein